MKAYISKIRIGKKVYEGVNFGRDLEATAVAIEGLWRTTDDAHVVAIRELSVEEIEAVRNGEKINY